MRTTKLVSKIKSRFTSKRSSRDALVSTNKYKNETTKYGLV